MMAASLNAATQDDLEGSDRVVDARDEPDAAFDEYFVGVRPDGVLEVRRDVLEEEDGPMLLHGLQGLHRRQLFLPHRKADRPDPELLARRYERFRKAS